MKIYFAGIENSESIEYFKKHSIENGFFSYYYARKKKEDLLTNLKPYVKNIIVDSGAHTFFSELQGEGLSVSVHSKKTKTKEGLDEYFAQYKNWIIENYHKFNYYVELDIGEIVGQEKVKEWRKELKEAKVFDKCIIVYHPRVTIEDEFIKELDESESKYVALEGDRPSRKRLPYLNLIKECYNKGIKVHGFAMTKDNVYYKLPFYSVDSSSWKAGVIFGVSKVLSKDKVKNIRFKEKKSILSVSNPLLIQSLSKIPQEARIAKCIMAIKAYEDISKKIERLWKARGIDWEKKINSFNKNI